MLRLRQPCDHNHIELLKLGISLYFVCIKYFCSCVTPTLVLCVVVIAASDHQVHRTALVWFPGEGLWEDDGSDPNREREGRNEVSVRRGVLCCCATGCVVLYQQIHIKLQQGHTFIDTYMHISTTLSHKYNNSIWEKYENNQCQFASSSRDQVMVIYHQWF